jgi:hypothetical protein
MIPQKAIKYMPIFIVIVLLLVIIYIVKQTDTSPVAKVVQWLSTRIEGFAPSPLNPPKCPDGFTFFNDKSGDSFCCGGSVNPYSHTCLAKNRDKLCAFKPNMKDPRNSAVVLPLCSKLIKAQITAAQKAFCPKSLPHYASSGKCCLSGTDLDGRNCLKFDSANKSRYCVIGNTLKSGEQKCDLMQLKDSAKCPSGLSSTMYTLGAKEIKKYGPRAKGQTIPVCFGMESSCIPNSVIKSVQAKGIFTDKKDLNNWIYACGGWEKINVHRDLTGKMDKAY